MNNDGADLSAGQRQLIALARAQLAKAHVLLLDEATALLDRTSEERLMTSLAEMVRREKRTALIVAHRLTTARRCDRIAVIDNGRLAEYGSHDELIAAHGLYACLWQAAHMIPKERSWDNFYQRHYLTTMHTGCCSPEQFLWLFILITKTSMRWNT